MKMDDELFVNLMNMNGEREKKINKRKTDKNEFH